MVTLPEGHVKGFGRLNERDVTYRSLIGALRELAGNGPVAQRDD
jgi:hypothetical protein